MDLSLDNVVNISVSESGAGLGQYNTSNLALFTDETPNLSFGNDGYAIYSGPGQVGLDFGTQSKVYQMAVAVFSQRPNILANNGRLIVIKSLAGVHGVTFKSAADKPAASGAFRLTFGGNQSALLQFDSTAAQVQTALRALAGLSSVVVTGDMETGFKIRMQGAPAGAITISSSTLQDVDSGNIAGAITARSAYESIADGILRTAGQVQYLGVMMANILSVSEQNEAAALLASLNKIGFCASRDPLDVEVGGRIDQLRQASLNKMRGLFFGGAADIDALLFQARYAGRGLSTVFSGSRTTSTMHLKDLVGQLPDPSMNETLLAKCQAAGADCYVSIQGVPKTFTSGKNKFFDSVYNLEWIIGALKTAYFNVLAQSSTKIAQTDEDLSKLTGAVRIVAEQARTNGYIAPGSWTLPDTFGVQEDFFANIEQRGYYIYTPPASSQLPGDREARKAPLTQLALKEAGAVHSGSILINVNK